MVLFYNLGFFGGWIQGCEVTRSQIFYLTLEVQDQLIHLMVPCKRQSSVNSGALKT